MSLEHLIWLVNKEAKRSINDDSYTYDHMLLDEDDTEDVDEEVEEKESYIAKIFG